MGAKITAFENRSRVDMEIRVFVPPARPDRYKKIFRIKPGEVKALKIRNLCCEELHQENPVFLMVFMEGVYSGVSLSPFHVKKYAKIFGYQDERGHFILKGIQARFSWILRLHYQVSCGVAAFLRQNKEGTAKELSYSMRKRQPGKKNNSA